jgi:hypothetical protein
METSKRQNIRTNRSLKNVDNRLNDLIYLPYGIQKFTTIGAEEKSHGSTYM